MGQGRQPSIAETHQNSQERRKRTKKPFNYSKTSFFLGQMKKKKQTMHKSVPSIPVYSICDGALQDKLSFSGLLIANFALEYIPTRSHAQSQVLYR